MLFNADFYRSASGLFSFLCAAGVAKRVSRFCFLEVGIYPNFLNLLAFVVQLLRETVLNATINKSILSSIYNFLSEKYASDRDLIKDFNTGLLADTPEYLGSYEAEGIKRLRR